MPPLGLCTLPTVLLLLIQCATAKSTDALNVSNVTRVYGTLNELTHNPNLTYVMTSPLDVQINVGDIGAFDIYLSKPLQSPLQIAFQCAGGECTTFDGATLQPVLLSAEQPNATVNFTSLVAGHDVIELLVADSPDADAISIDYAYVRVRVGRSHFLEVLSFVFGWTYFVAWSASFYPQNISNYRRKSVRGLNFDYMILHFTGFIFYAIFNLTLFFSKHVQEEYESRFPRSELPVQLNDVVYSLHAAVLTATTWIQCLIYESGGHRHSIYSKLLQGAIWLVGAVLMVLCILNLFSWLNFVYYFSYLKLMVTGIKYLPQVIYNFRRKSTRGWSIYMIYLDVTGGSMGLLQMMTIAFNYNDWKTLIGNLPKLGLSLACMFYDIIFLLQEFVFYRNSNNSKRCKKLAAFEERNGNNCKADPSSSEPSITSISDEASRIVLEKNETNDLKLQLDECNRH